MATPIGILGGIRGTLFANVGGASWNERRLQRLTRTTPSIERPIVDYTTDPTNPDRGIPVYGDPVLVDGFRLVDARASYGIGLQTFALGFPIHFDWSWRTLFNRTRKT